LTREKQRGMGMAMPSGLVGASLLQRNDMARLLKSSKGSYEQTIQLCGNNDERTIYEGIEYEEYLSKVGGLDNHPFRMQHTISKLNAS